MYIYRERERDREREGLVEVVLADLRRWGAYVLNIYSRIPVAQLHEYE